MLYAVNALFAELLLIQLLNQKRSSLIFNINQQKTALKRIKKLPKSANLPLETYEEEILNKFAEKEYGNHGIILDADAYDEFRLQLHDEKLIQESIEKTRIFLNKNNG